MDKLLINKRPSRKAEPFGAWTVHQSFDCKPKNALASTWEAVDASEIAVWATNNSLAACRRCWNDADLETDNWQGIYRKR
jgi:hypothetical protein